MFRVDERPRPSCPARVPDTPAREHARRLVHLGYQHALPPRRGAEQPGGVRRERVLHGRDGPLRHPDRRRRGRLGQADVVPARHLDLSVSTLLYWLLWEMKGPFWAWAIVSMLLGLGFTFFSGAVEAWLVDALHYAEYDGALEVVMGRGQMVSGAAMLGGSVAGGGSPRRPTLVSRS